MMNVGDKELIKIRENITIVGTKFDPLKKWTPTIKIPSKNGRLKKKFWKFDKINEFISFKWFFLKKTNFLNILYL